MPWFRGSRQRAVAAVTALAMSVGIVAFAAHSPSRPQTVAVGPRATPGSDSTTLPDDRVLEETSTTTPPGSTTITVPPRLPRPSTTTTLPIVPPLPTTITTAPKPDTIDRPGMYVVGRDGTGL